MSAQGIDKPEGYPHTSDFNDAKPLLGDPLEEMIRITGGGLEPAVISIKELLRGGRLKAECGECEEITDLVVAKNLHDASKLESESPRLTLVGPNLGCDDPDCYFLECSNQWRFLTLLATALLPEALHLYKEALFKNQFVQYAWNACSQDVVALVRVFPDEVRHLCDRVAFRLRISATAIVISEYTLAFEDVPESRVGLATPFNFID